MYLLPHSGVQVKSVVSNFSVECSLDRSHLAPVMRDLFPQCSSPSPSESLQSEHQPQECKDHDASGFTFPEDSSS